MYHHSWGGLLACGIYLPLGRRLARATSLSDEDLSAVLAAWRVVAGYQHVPRIVQLAHEAGHIGRRFATLWPRKRAVRRSAWRPRVAAGMVLDPNVAVPIEQVELKSNLLRTKLAWPSCTAKGGCHGA